MLQRFYRIAKPASVILVLGFVYFLLHELTGFGLFCPIRQFLHLYCPGCGVSRMFFHLLHFEFAEAFSSNCVVFCLLPFGVCGALFHGYRYVRYGNGQLFGAERIILWVIVGILLVFGVLRNVYPVDILIP